MTVSKIDGIVIAGNRIGRQLGVPTANIALDQSDNTENGVYAARTTINGKEYDAVANIGCSFKCNKLNNNILDDYDDIISSLSFSIPL